MALLVIDAQAFRTVAAVRCMELGRPVLSSVCIDPDGVVMASDGYRALAWPNAAQWLHGTPRRLCIRPWTLPGVTAQTVQLSLPDDPTVWKADQQVSVRLIIDGKDRPLEWGVTTGADYPDVRALLRRAHHQAHAATGCRALRVDTQLLADFTFSTRRPKESAIMHYPTLAFASDAEAVAIEYDFTPAVGLVMPMRMTERPETVPEWLEIAGKA